MNNGLSSFLARLRAAVGSDQMAAATDAVLLGHFVRDRDDTAFAELVRRHGPAVLAACRNAVPDAATADDAFQATFLVLARRSGDIRDPERLGGWLRGVARRVSIRARRRATKRAAAERPLDSVPEPTTDAALPTADLRTVLGEELDRLPSDYREAITLCDVDGLPRREAAKRLGIPDGTLSNRLTRARALIGRRLLRRGVALGAGAMLGAGSTSMAVVPAHLFAATVQQVFSDSVPLNIAALVAEALNPMSVSRKLAALIALLPVVGVVVVGVVFLTRGPKPPTTEPEADVARTPATAVSGRAGPQRPWKEPTFGEGITAAAYTADRKQAVMLQSHKRPYPSEEGGYRLFVYDTVTWKAAHILDLPNTPSVGPMAMTKDGKRVFLGWNATAVYEWEPGAKEPKKKFDLGSVRVAGREPKPAPDGKLDERLQLSALNLTPDGKTIAALIKFVENGHSVGWGVRIWDANTGQMQRTIPVRPGDNNWFAYPTLRFADDGRTVTVVAHIGTYDEQRHELIEWDVNTGREKRRIDVAAAVGPYQPWPIKPNPWQATCQSVDYAADGKWIAVCGGYMAPEEKVTGLRPNSGGVTLYTRSGRLWILDRESGKVLKTLIDDRVDLVRSAKVSTDGKKLIVTMSIPTRKGWSGSGNTDDEYVEIQQWDTTTWERDWVKFADKVERWKVLAGTDR